MGGYSEQCPDCGEWFTDRYEYGKHLTSKHPRVTFEGVPSFHPMPGKVAVRLIEEAALGGLILANSTSRVMGEVIALGDDEEDGDTDYDVSLGDIVMFGPNSGVKVGLDGIVEGRRQRREVMIFRTSEILCKVTWEKETS